MTTKKNEVSEHIGKIIKMNIDLAGFKAGQRWIYEHAPKIVRLWADLPGIYGETPIVTVLDEMPEDESQKDRFKCPKCGYIEGDSLEPIEPQKTLQELNQEKINAFDNIDKVNRKCRGKNIDGSPCRFTGNKVLDNDFCFRHQDQAGRPEKTLETEAG